MPLSSQATQHRTKTYRTQCNTNGTNAIARCWKTVRQDHEDVLLPGVSEALSSRQCQPYNNHHYHNSYIHSKRDVRCLNNSYMLGSSETLATSTSKTVSTNKIMSTACDSKDTSENEWWLSREVDLGVTICSMVGSLAKFMKSTTFSIEPGHASIPARRAPVKVGPSNLIRSQP